MAALRALIIIATIVAGCATRQQAPSSPSVSGPPATLYVFHDGGTQQRADVWDNGAMVAKVEGQKYVRLSISAGSHHICSIPPSLSEAESEAIDIDAQPEATYYVVISSVSPTRTFAQLLAAGVIAAPVNVLTHTFTGRYQDPLASAKRVPVLGVLCPVKSVSAEEAQTLMKEMTLQDKALAE